MSQPVSLSRLPRQAPTLYFVAVETDQSLAPARQALCPPSGAVSLIPAPLRGKEAGGGSHKKTLCVNTKSWAGEDPGWLVLAPCSYAPQYSLSGGLWAQTSTELLLSAVTVSKPELPEAGLLPLQSSSWAQLTQIQACAPPCTLCLHSCCSSCRDISG